MFHLLTMQRYKQIRRFFLLVILICIFAVKLFVMKKYIFYVVLFFFSVFIASCGIYKEPCEGVGKINISQSDS